MSSDYPYDIDWSPAVPERLYKPLRWSEPRRVRIPFDLFHKDRTFEQIAAVFGVMAAAPQHTFQVLTKRPERMLAWFAWLLRQADGGGMPLLCYGYACQIGNWWGTPYDDDRAGADWPLPNAWLGVSAEDQATADERIPLLLQCPAAVRFVSAEPLVGAIDFSRCPYREPSYCTHCSGHEHLCEGLLNGLDWVIVGGESGAGARPCDVAWIRSIVEQCGAAGVPVFVKQLGAKPYDSETGGLGRVQCPACEGSGVYKITDEDTQICAEWDCNGTGQVLGYQSGVSTTDRKGGDPDEWPAELRVRQWPEVKR